MLFGLIKEYKTPPDKRVVFSPKTLLKVREQFPEAEFIVESSDIRVFSDDDYRKQGFKVVDDISDAQVLLGVKEVPVDLLIPNKKYFFFSHTIKKQPYNRKLLQVILEKNIELFDHETIVGKDEQRLIGFGYYAGIVGTYNCFRAYGEKSKTFNIPKANTLRDKDVLYDKLAKIILPNIKIVLTGNGKVGTGVKEVLDEMKIKEVSVNDYLNKEFKEAVYTQIDVLDYSKRKDGIAKDNFDFYKNAEDYESTFMKFAKVSDVFIAGHFYGQGAPYLFTREDAKSKDFKIKVVADISCDVDGPVASTLRASTIEKPFYGYDAETEMEVDYTNEDAIMVMAVDNLPCELPNDASVGFGDMFLEHVIPAFFNNDTDGILERAKITKKGKLTGRFSYLQDYVNGN